MDARPLCAAGLRPGSERAAGDGQLHALGGQDGSYRHPEDRRPAVPRGAAWRRPRQHGHAAVHGVGPQGLPLLRHHGRLVDAPVREAALLHHVVPLGRHRGGPGAVPAERRQGPLPDLLPQGPHQARQCRGARPPGGRRAQGGVRQRRGLRHRRADDHARLRVLHLRCGSVHAPILPLGARRRAGRARRRAPARARCAAPPDAALHGLRHLGRLPGLRARAHAEAAQERHCQALRVRRHGAPLHGADRGPETGGS
mmetsp:Transcript_95299/g.246289  ORF Transcript_95299/g.246289 Transcript_95299/m.246289 type:complete len:255 (-) Transcript_95299:1049-1813(-)